MFEEILVIDERRSNSFQSDLGSSWRLISDSVMGGISNGSLTLDYVDGKACLRLQGTLRLENGGGFIQAALDVSQTQASDASGFRGAVLEVYGNDQVYNLHLRTEDIRLPWQSYRASFLAPPRWQCLKLPFEAFTGYRVSKKLDTGHLRRIGIVAIGREFKADLCIAKIALY